MEGVYNENNSVSLKWSSVSDSIGYKLYRISEDLKEIDSLTPIYVGTNVKYTNRQKYLSQDVSRIKYVVVAYNQNGRSVLSNEISIEFKSVGTEILVDIQLDHVYLDNLMSHAKILGKLGNLDENLEQKFSVRAKLPSGLSKMQIKKIYLQLIEAKKSLSKKAIKRYKDNFSEQA